MYVHILFNQWHNWFKRPIDYTSTPERIKIAYLMLRLKRQSRTSLLFSGFYLFIFSCQKHN